MIFKGIGGLPGCGDRDYFCKRRHQAFESQAYTDYAQTHIVAAQYYRDTIRYEEYLKQSKFLADVNNERSIVGSDGSIIHGVPSYADNLKSLQSMVLVMFEDDETVIPKESAWFFDYDKANDEAIPLKDGKMYKEDWLGLKTLEDQGKLFYETLPGEHMEIDIDDLKDLLKQYF